MGSSLTWKCLDLTTKGKRKVTSQEIDDIEGLRRIYSNVRSVLTEFVKLADEVPSRLLEAMKPYSAYSMFKTGHLNV